MNNFIKTLFVAISIYIIVEYVKKNNILSKINFLKKPEEIQEEDINIDTDEEISEFFTKTEEQNDTIESNINDVVDEIINKQSTGTNTFMDISIDNKNEGRIIFELFDDIVPITTKNFKALSEKAYQGKKFNRIIRDFMIQGGDITNNDGSGGMSIYGKTFKDENFNLSHDKPGLLSMANSGSNTNASQFFITTTEASHLDGKHVVFGKVVHGYDVVEKIENTLTDHDDKPIVDVIITNCGVL